MSEIEQKALALVNKIAAERGTEYPCVDRRNDARWEALCRAIEEHEADKAAHAATIEGILNSHEAYKQEVSDAVEAYNDMWRKRTPGRDEFMGQFFRFIVTKPDPLADAWIEATGNTVGMEPLNEALAKRGLKIVETER